MAGELDNRTPGKMTGWMRFFRNGKTPLRVTFDLVGDFHDDIRGTMIRLSNPQPYDEYRDEGKTYMDGFSRVQRGTVGDMTAGLALGPWTEDLVPDKTASKAVTATLPASWCDEICRRGSRLGGWAARNALMLERQSSSIRAVTIWSHRQSIR